MVEIRILVQPEKYGAISHFPDECRTAQKKSPLVGLGDFCCGIIEQFFRHFYVNQKDYVNHSFLTK